MAVVSDIHPVMGERASDMLNFGRMGLNYRLVVRLCETVVGWLVMGEHTFRGATRRGPSRKLALQPVRHSGGSQESTRYERSNLRDVNNVSKHAVLLNSGYDDTSRSNRSVSFTIGHRQATPNHRFACQCPLRSCRS